MAEITVIPTLQVRPNYLVIYNQLEGIRRRPRDQWQYELQEKDRKKAYAGLITPGSAKNLKRCIENLIEIALPKKAVNHSTGKEFTFKINFITLTLPCEQGKWTDKDVKRMCLDTWLKSARRRFGLRNYVWRAERQHNGNIHFHIASDCYIDHVQLRNSWNDRLEHCSYITKFEKKHKHRNPNSTDVHSVKKIRSLASYLVKYMSKGHVFAELLRAQPPWQKPAEQMKWEKSGPKFRRVLSRDEIKINGRLWDCSENLKRKEKCEFIVDGDITERLRQLIIKDKARVKDTEVCSLVFMSPQQKEKFITGRIREAWEEWLKAMRN